MNLMRAALAVTIVAAWAAPAAAQRYSATEHGDVVELVDADAQMNVSVAWNMCNEWRIQVKGTDLVRTSPTLPDFQACPGFNGMPFLAPFANRLDETAFYANGNKYNVKVAPPAIPHAEGAAAPTSKGFIAFEPMVAITNALNLAHNGVYKELQNIPPGGSWEESFWITTKGY